MSHGYKRPGICISLAEQKKYVERLVKTHLTPII